MDELKKLYSASIIAELFDMTERNVRYLEEQKIIDKCNRGKYPLWDSVQRYVKFLKEKAHGRQVEGSPLDKEKTLHEKAKREKAEMLVAKLKNEMHTSKDVEKIMTNMIVNARAKLLSLSSKVAPQLIGQKNINTISDIIDGEIRAALEELSDYDPQMFNDLEGEDDGTENEDAT